MTESEYLEQFIHTRSVLRPESQGQKFAGREGVVALLVYEGLGIMLPELKARLKLGGTVISLKRLEIRKKLEAYALEKELDFEAAEQAAQNIADHIDQETLEKLVDALERSRK